MFFAIPIVYHYTGTRETEKLTQEFEQNLEKVQEDEFRYRMYQTQVSDAGLYRCVVTAWSPVRGSLWREAATSLSNPIEIDFQTSGEQGNLVRHRLTGRDRGVLIQWPHFF